MTKKTLITLIISGAIVIVGICIALYAISFKNVSFNVKREGIEVSIYKADDRDLKKVISSFTKSTSIKLQAGNYVAVPKSDTYDTTPIFFAVDNTDTTVTIEPGFGFSYLDKLLQQELSTIKPIINSRFSKNIADYTLADGKLYGDGEWYVTTLTQKTPVVSEIGDVYRIVLRKQNGTWSIIGKPSLVLTTSEFKEVPLTILQDANRMGE